MRIYGNGQCRGCHKQVVCRDMRRPDNQAECRKEHAVDCPEFERDLPELAKELEEEERSYCERCRRDVCGCDEIYERGVDR